MDYIISADLLALICYTSGVYGQPQIDCIATVHTRADSGMSNGNKGLFKQEL